MAEVRADMLIRSMIEVTAPVGGLLALIVLLFMALVNARSKNRLRSLASSAFQVTEDSNKACRAQRATDFLDAVLSKSYYVMGMVSIGALCLMPFLRMPLNSRIILLATFHGLMSISAGIIYLNIRDRDLDGEISTRKRLYDTELLGSDTQTLVMYDPISGMYTVGFWLRALELRVKRKFYRYAPVTCVLLELPELKDIRMVYGESVADEVVRQFAGDMKNSSGSDDLWTRVGYDQFVVAAMRCPADKASIIGQRIAHNATRVTVVGDGAPLNFVLRIRWLSATSPLYVVNPSQLLHSAITSMDREDERPHGSFIPQPRLSQQAAA